MAAALLSARDQALNTPSILTNILEYLEPPDLKSAALVRRWEFSSVKFLI